MLLLLKMPRLLNQLVHLPSASCFDLDMWGMMIHAHEADRSLMAPHAQLQASQHIVQHFNSRW